MSRNDQGSSTLSRRTIMKMGGVALAGLYSTKAISAFSTGQSNSPFAPDDSIDPAVHSRVENLFWCEMMTEHAEFFAQLMPGAGVANERTQAENFQRSFKAHCDRIKSVQFERPNYVELNRLTVDLIKPFAEYKRRMREAQDSGKIRTFVFPLFFDHTAREADRAVARLEALSAGNVALDYKEVIDFWTNGTSDEIEIIAHLLDPREQDLISSALDSSALLRGFQEANHNRMLPRGEILLATEEVIDFETLLEDGIQAGRIKSILDPRLTAHMRRETLKFIDELKRTAAKT
jgi:DUF2935 family protein